MGHTACNQEEWLRELKDICPAVKLKDTIQQVLVAHNCWRMDAILKLPQWESQAQMYAMQTSRSLFLASRGMVSKWCLENKEA